MGYIVFGKSKVSSVWVYKKDGILSMLDDNIVHGKLGEDCKYQKVLFNPMIWREAVIIGLILINDDLWSGIRWIGERKGGGIGE